MFTKCVEDSSASLSMKSASCVERRRTPTHSRASPPDAARHRQLSVAPAVGCESNRANSGESPRASVGKRAFMFGALICRMSSRQRAAAERCQAAHSDDRIDFRLSNLQHLGNRGMLSAKTKAAGSVDTNAR
jgi:hypothetical protein